jgi:hypothetical protein
MADSTRRAVPHTPDWQVIGVVADGDGLPEFSYTVGLHERGLPELFLWDRPSGGTDPGEDWRFRDLERGRLLNHWARQLINGDLHPGMTWTEEMDFGLASVTFTTGELVEPLTVEALMAAPSAKVMPVRYALRRDPLREPTEADAAARAEIRQWTADVVEALTTGRGARPPAQSLPEPPYDTSLVQPFGPATPLVKVLRAAVTAAGPRELEDLIAVSISMEMHGLIYAERAIAATAAYARAVGLHEQRAAAEGVAMDDAHRKRQERAVRQGFSEFMGERLDTRAGRRAVYSLTHQLGNALGAAYTAAVVIDTLPHDLRTSALGPVLTALTAGSVPRLWFDQGTREGVRSLLGDLTRAQVSAICRTFEDLQDETCAVHVAALTGPGDSPPVEVLLAGTRTLADLTALLGSQVMAQNKIWRSLEDIARAFACPDLPAAAVVRAAFEVARRS